ncbi:DUF3304 domain-containing protein [Ralstonia psammae]|nr:DUF3304 domain-containing protein [Ralstonia sp. LMG 19083]
MTTISPSLPFSHRRFELINAMNSWIQHIYARWLLLPALLAGCAMTGQVNAMDIVGYNYTDDVVEAFSVNGYPGPNIYPHGGGGGFVCCISVPQEWKPGMTVTVKWTDDRNADPIPWKTRVVEVPRYTHEDMGVFAVHFFPGDEVKVLVTDKLAGHADYPYPVPQVGRRRP